MRKRLMLAVAALVVLGGCTSMSEPSQVHAAVGASTPPAPPLLSVASTTDSTAVVLESTNEQNGIIRIGFVLGTNGPHQTSPVSQTQWLNTSAPVSIRVPLANLLCGSVYSIQGFAANVLGTTYNNSQSFTTSSCSTIPSLSVMQPFPFTRDLQLGLSGIDVRALQQFLNTHGFVVASQGVGSRGNESTYFGRATQAALRAFQKAHGFNAVGYFGARTRSFMMKV